MKFSRKISKFKKLNLERFLNVNNRNSVNQQLTSELNVKLNFKAEFYLKLPINFSATNSTISGKVNEFKIGLISIIISILIFLVFVLTYRIGLFSLFLSLFLGLLVYLDLRKQLKKALANFIKSLYF